MNTPNYLVIGGSHGIGLALVRQLVEQGATVTVVSRTVGELGDLPSVTHLQQDVIAEEFETKGWPETIDGLAYCPGSIRLGSIRNLRLNEMMEDFQLNAAAAVRCIQAALPALKAAKSSSIVLFSTVAVSTGLPMHTSIAAAKGAVEGITRTLAAELAPQIRVNCIAPALTATPLSQRLLDSDQKQKAMADMYPLKRFGQPEDIASAAAFLLGNQSGWITGQTLGIDGGMSRVRK